MRIRRKSPRRTGRLIDHVMLAAFETLTRLSVLEIEMRGRVTADVCREARERLARVLVFGDPLGVDRDAFCDALSDASRAARSRGGCCGCQDARAMGAAMCARCGDAVAATWGHL